MAEGFHARLVVVVVMAGAIVAMMAAVVAATEIIVAAVVAMAIAVTEYNDGTTTQINYHAGLGFRSGHRSKTNNRQSREKKVFHIVCEIDASHRLLAENLTR
ncbi:MAG: hypothetical protein ACAI35_16240 [Candidatus Methylacidiphilales bacterium]